MSELKIGLIGLDTSHVLAFTSLLNDPSNEHHVPGAKVVAAYPGGSPDFPASIDRVEGFTIELRDNYGVAVLDSPAEVAAETDAILLTSVDGRVHLRQFEETLPFRHPTFIDKPFAVSSSDARAIANLAREYGIPLLSSSSLRFAEAFTEARRTASKENIWGADISGPMAIEPTQPGLFWYGIHTTEMLYTILGPGCTNVTATSNEDHDLIVGEWQDGRIGTIRGNRTGGEAFSALLHTASGSHFVDPMQNPKPAYASLLEQIIPMFQGGPSPIKIEETLEIIRFIEASNESRHSGLRVYL